MVTARGWAANSINARVCLTADNDRLEQEARLLLEGPRIKDLRRPGQKDQIRFLDAKDSSVRPALKRDAAAEGLP